MKRYVNKFNGRSCINVEFESINEVVRFIKEHEHTKEYENYNSSVDGSYNFTKTHSYEEAEDLLLHGWESMAKELKTDLKAFKAPTKAYSKPAYGMVGYQASVPRYLQGIPQNMIYKKQEMRKEKIVNINKSFNYSWRVDSEQIKQESLKVLDLVNQIESTGTRTNLYISFITCGQYGENAYKDNKYVCIKIKIKSSRQRLNLKQMAFPLAHPSMFRRITFALIERMEETRNNGGGYGRALEYQECKGNFKNEIYIESIIPEERITDMNKYMVK